MTDVTFLELKVANKDRVICDVLEKLHEMGQRIIVYAEDTKHIQLLHQNFLLMLAFFEILN